MFLNTFYPFDLKNINSIKEYLFIIKNCFRLIKKNGIRKKIEGLCFYVAWSSSKKKYFITNLNNFKISSVDLDYIKEIINTEKINLFFKNYNMKKNLNRHFIFIYRDKKVYPVGLYSNIERNNTYKLINNSNYIVKEISELDSRIENTKLQFKLLNYIDEYNKFIESIKKTTVYFDENRSINLADFLGLKRCAYHKKISYKKYINLINKKIFPTKEAIFYFVIYHITIELGLYLNNLLIEENSENIDFILIDQTSLKIIKIPSKFYYVKIEKDVELLPPLMPLRF